MPSHLAQKLAELLKETERRELNLSEKEKAFNAMLQNVREREDSVKIREEEVRDESLKLSEFKNVAEERQKTVNLMNLIKRKEEELADQRQLFATESDSQSKILHKERVELGEWKERLKKQEEDLVANIELLKQEKIKHHEQVLADLADLESKKREVTSANI